MAMLQMDSIPALEWPESGPPRDSMLEGVCTWVPILGWCVGALSWHLRSRSIVRHIERQLKARLPIDPEVWVADGGRREFARWLSVTIAGEMGWCNDRFVPDDPIKILCWAHRDGLDINFLLDDLADKIGRPLSDDEVAHLGAMTLGQAVDYLLSLPSSKE